MLALSKWEMSKHINCLIHIGSWQIDLEILFSPIRCCFWDGLFHIFLYWFGGLWLLLLRIERQFSSSGRYLTECFKISFYHPFLNWYFMSLLCRVMVPSIFFMVGKISIYNHFHHIPFVILFWISMKKVPALKLCRILMTLVAIIIQFLTNYFI